jgi:hypothetical protein
MAVRVAERAQVSSAVPHLAREVGGETVGRCIPPLVCFFPPPLCVSPALPGSSAPMGTGEGGGTDSFVLFAGSKQSGKSSLVTQFLNPSKEVGGCGGCCSQPCSFEKNT